jgi:hypothetical protein
VWFYSGTPAALSPTEVVSVLGATAATGRHAFAVADEL